MVLNLINFLPSFILWGHSIFVYCIFNYFLELSHSLLIKTKGKIICYKEKTKVFAYTVDV